MTQGLFLRDWTIGDGHQLFVNNHFHVKGCFLNRMIKTRKCAACVALLKLRYRNEFFISVHNIFASIKTSHLVIDLTHILDLELYSSFHLFRKRDAHLLSLRFHGERTAHEAIMESHFTVPDGQVQYV